MNRWLGIGLLAFASFGVDPAHATPSGFEVTLVADRDDDDDDGVADADHSPRRSASEDLRDVRVKQKLELRSIEGTAVRVLAGDRAYEQTPPGRTPVRRVRLQGLRAGRSHIDFGSVQIDATVLEVRAMDAAGQPIDLATSHASITRVLPRSLDPDRAEPFDTDAVRWLVMGPAGSVPDSFALRSLRPGGEPLDRIESVALSPWPCPPQSGPGIECRASALVRATSDGVDRSHPASSSRSLEAEVGGRLVVEVAGNHIGIRVGGPRRTALGPVDRYRAKIRMHLVRLSPGGAMPIGNTAAEGRELAAAELRTASALWGQCGIHFGGPDAPEVKIVDPPAPHFVSLGCDLGTPASGGRVSFRVGGRRVRADLRAGDTPTVAAGRVAAAVRAAGFRATLSANATTSVAALRTVDVLVRRRDDSIVPLSEDGKRPLSSDSTLDVCLGEVDLADGLEHFTDYDAPAGTIEERALIKALDDGDPSTIDVFVVPSFAQSGRIGESFIRASGAAIRNAIIMDRTGIRAASRSFALAHELGHVLLDMPGHPDDYGVDVPTMLMDADAADPSIFGPRRLSVAECVRAIRQSGPGAPVELLDRWPLVRPRAR